MFQVLLHQKGLTAAHDTCRQLLENLGFHDALPPEPQAEPSSLSSVDAAAQSLEDAHLHNASLAGGDGFGDGLSPHGEDNGDFFEQQGTPAGHSETSTTPFSIIGQFHPAPAVRIWCTHFNCKPELCVKPSLPRRTV